LSTGFFNSAESVVTYAQMAAEVILLLRLAWLGLIQEFKVFWLFLAYDVVLTVALSRWNYHSPSYEWMWAVTAPVWTLLLAGATLELLRGLAQPIPRETRNRTFALYGFLIGMTVSAGGCMLAHPQTIFRPAILLTTIARSCVLSGCIFAILAQAGFLGFGGAPLIANCRRHRRVMLVLLTGVVVGSFLDASPHSQLTEWADLLRGVTLFGCYCAWIPMFERAWSHLRVLPACRPGFPQEFPSEETLAEIFAYRAREARYLAKQVAPRRA
jgi:hypothetical protein